MRLLLRYCLLVLASFSAASAQQNSLLLLSVETENYPVLGARFFLSDSSGMIIRDLLPSDLFIDENGQSRELLSLSCPTSNLPERLSSVLAIDISGSMENRGNMEIARSAARAWIDALPLGYSECAVTSFNHLGHLNQDFTVDHDDLLDALNTLAPIGSTDYEAGLISDPLGAIRIASTGQHKPVVIFLTDGQSPGDEEEIVRLARDHGVVIYTIVLRMPAPEILKHVAERTGGEWFEQVESREEAEVIYQTILHIAQEDEPCEVTWQTELSCETDRELKISIPFYNVMWSGDYALPFQQFPHLVSLPSTISFGEVLPGEVQDTVIRITAEEGSVEVRGVTFDDPHFRLVSTNRELPHLLAPGQEMELKVEFAPTDSGFRFSPMTIQSDACDQERLLLSGGWSGIRSPKRLLELIDPNGGEVYPVGGEVMVEWKGALPEDTLLLEYSTDGGEEWEIITEKATGLSYRWNVPPTPSNRCLMRIRQLTADGESGMMTFYEDQTLTAGTFTPDGLSILVGGSWWDITTFSLLDRSSRTVPTPSSRGFLGLEFSPDGNTLLISSGDIHSYLYDWSGDSVLRWVGGSGNILSLSTFSPDGSRILSHAYTDDVLIYDVATGNLLQTLVGHNYRGFAVDWSPDGTTLASGSNEGLSGRQGILWDAGSGALIDSLPHPNQVNSVAFSPDSRSLVTACHDSVVRVWDVATGDLRMSIREPARVADATYSPDGGSIAVALLDGEARIHNAFTGELERELVGHQSEVRHIEYSPDGSRILTVSRDSTARVWELARLPDQWDESDAFWSIVEPRITSLFVDMGRVGVGSYRDSVVTGWICNTGSVPLQIDSITFAGSGFFSTVSELPPYQLLPGECHPIEFRFRPRLVGLFTDSVVIHSGTAELIATIRGEGIVTPLRVELPAIDFGQVLLGTSKDTLVKAVVTNVGPIPLLIESVESGGPDRMQFGILSGGDSFVLQPGEFHEMELRFSPQKKGRTSSTILLRYDGTGNMFFGYQPVEVRLLGEGICPEIAGEEMLFIPENMRADAGEEIVIPILVERSDVPAKTVAQEYQVLLRFNKTLLAPLDQPELDLSDDQERYLLYRGRWSGSGDTVALLRFTAALGNAASTPVAVEMFRMEDGCYGGVSRRDGSFLLNNLCEDGGTRLFLLNDSLFLKPVRPNPARSDAEIRFSLIEEGETELFLIDERGQKIITFHSGYMDSGEYTENIDTESLPSGRYVVVLSTPTRILSQTFLIEH